MTVIQESRQSIANTQVALLQSADNLAKLNPRNMTTAEVQKIFDGMVKMLRGVSEGYQTQINALDQIERLIDVTRN